MSVYMCVCGGGGYMLRGGEDVRGGVHIEGGV